MAIDVKAFDLRIVFKERRFLGVRLWLYSFPLALIGFILFLTGLQVLGMFLFFVAWIGAIMGFFIHLSRWRDHQ